MAKKVADRAKHRSRRYKSRSTIIILSIVIGIIHIYCLRENGQYEKVDHSKLLPNLDIDLLAAHSRMADQYDAIQSFIEILRQG
jgi:hypothetical protein